MASGRMGSASRTKLGGTDEGVAPGLGIPNSARLAIRGFCYNSGDEYKLMMNPKTLDQISAAVSRVLPQELASDVKKNMRAALESVFDRLDLVTREELEVQEAVLARTREQLQELEKKIATLEEKLAKK